MYCVAWLKDGRSQSPLGKIYWFHLLFKIKSIFIVIILLLQFLFIFVIKGLNSSKSDYGCFNLNEKIISKWTAMRCFIMKKKRILLYANVNSCNSMVASQWKWRKREKKHQLVNSKLLVVFMFCFRDIWIKMTTDRYNFFKLLHIR